MLARRLRQLGFGAKRPNVLSMLSMLYVEACSLLQMDIEPQFRKTLHEAEFLMGDERKRVLSLLCKLAQSAYVFPRCYELQGVQYNPLKPLGGGGYADVFKGEYENRVICLKIVRLGSKHDKLRMLAVSVVIFYIGDLGL